MVNTTEMKRSKTDEETTDDLTLDDSTDLQ